MFFGLGAVRISAQGEAGEAAGEWRLSFPSSDTALAKPPGTWIWWVITKKGEDRVTADNGRIEILPNPEETGPVEPRSLTRATLDEARQTRYRLVQSEVSQTTFQGHTFTLLDIEKLDKIIRALEAELGGEDNRPGQNKKLVYTRFRRI